MIHYLLIVWRRVATDAGVFVCLFAVLSQVFATTETRRLPVDSFQQIGLEYDDPEFETRPCGLDRCANSMRASDDRLDEESVGEIRRPDILIDDFERSDHQGWDVSGVAFGNQPARGTLPNQMAVSGYSGHFLLSSFWGGDATIGEAWSSDFTIQRKYLAFLIGGGRDPERLAIALWVDGKEVRRTTGPESEQLEWGNWDVEAYEGQIARIRVFDQASGGWGHISIDQITQTDRQPSRFGLDEKLAEYRQSAEYMNEPWRPQFHFSPEINWMNDPNGLVYFDGEYHLFFQYNPGGNQWGHMSWGHAVSTDLVNWQHLPVAIPESEGMMAFSGSCVVDRENTTGFGSDGKTPLVAIFTGHRPGHQVQNLAYSLDHGRTWTAFEGNPVIDLGVSDFRDPKVFWHEESKQWIMIVSLALEKVIVFYGSPDLKSWRELSRFGPAGAIYKGNWECPDLFELPVDNEPGKRLWVLETDMGDGSIAGGSGGEYFVGTFDGQVFTALQAAQWVDFGRDFYAPISWDSIPPADGRRLWIGWMNNWQTSLIPTSPWRGSMSLPRALSLRKGRMGAEGPEAYRLIQQPASELKKLRSRTIDLGNVEATWPPVTILDESTLRTNGFEVKVTLRPGEARSIGLRFRTGKDEYTEVGWDRWDGGVYVDRREAGKDDFHSAFAGRHIAPARLINGTVELQLFYDRSSLELFVNRGEAVITDRIFPLGDGLSIEAFGGAPSAMLEDIHVYPMKSIWHSESRD